MSTRIVQELGIARSARSGALAIDVPAALRDRIELGGHMSLNGVYLSARELSADTFTDDVSKETACRTTLGSLRARQHVNLELPVSPNRGLDDHLVLGHVNAIGRVQALYREGPGWTLIVESPSQYRRFVVDKGSVAVEGISLTPYDLDGGSFRDAIIPDTHRNRGVEGSATRTLCQS